MHSLHQHTLSILDKTPGLGLAADFARDVESIINPKAYSGGGDSVGGQNTGLIVYSRNKLVEDPAFAALAYGFYEEINQLDFARASRDASEKHPLGLRASLGDASGSARTLGQKPGWLWEKALQYTKGDANQAMRMIGLCGHDDTSNNFPSVNAVDGPEYAPGYEAIYRTRREIQAELDRQESPDEKNGLHSSTRQEKARNLRHAMLMADISLALKNKSQPSSFPCPGMSSQFYYPDAMGEGLNVPPAMRKKLAAYQAPSSAADPAKALSLLPAKHYHTMGAAYVSCELIRLGWPAALVKRAQTSMAWLYRTQRMNTLMRSLNGPVSPDEWPPETWKSEFDRNQRAADFLHESRKDSVNFFRRLLDRFAKLPGQAPWEKINSNYKDESYEQLKLLKVIANRYLENPAQSPFDPPLSREEFERMLPAIKKFAYKAKEAPPAAYELYLERNREFNRYWNEKIDQISDKAGMDEKEMIERLKMPFYGVNNILLTSATEVFRPSPKLPTDSMSHFRMKYFQWVAGSPEKQKEFADKKIKRDAAELMRRWTFSGPRKLGSLSFSLPYNDIRLPLPEALEGTAVERWVFSKPEGWSDERFRAAQQVVKSWWIDWDWTVAQHKKGAEFAAKHCRGPARPMNAVDPMGNITGEDQTPAPGASGDAR